jgi:two-component system response regulator FixJ
MKPICLPHLVENAYEPGMERNNIALIDSDYARRARIVSALMRKGRYVEPFESLKDFMSRRHDRQVVLVHDEGTLVQDVIGWCMNEGQLVGAVAYAQEPDPKSVVSAIRSGAVDYCQWPIDPDSLEDVLESCEAISEQAWVSLERTINARKAIERLTAREKEVLFSITAGLSTKEIAKQLNISIRTVEVHRTHLICKIGASNSSEAVRIAMEAQIKQFAEDATRAA